MLYEILFFSTQEYFINNKIWIAVLDIKFSFSAIYFYLTEMREKQIKQCPMLIFFSASKTPLLFKENSNEYKNDVFEK